MNIYPGTIVKVKLVRYKLPVVAAKVIDMSMALYGNMRVELDNGERAMALYPPLEVLGERTIGLSKDQ